MRLARNARVALAALAALGFAIVAVPSCDSEGHDSASCDYVVRRCRTFCDYGYGCDYYWGCCYDRCWYDCVGSGKRDPVDTPPSTPSNPPSTPPPTDAGTSTDASAPSSGDFAVLCAPCTSNDQCKGGGLCITRGGEDAGASGFCGSPCGGSGDCPADFTCAQIGESMQCVPTNGTCN